MATFKPDVIAEFNSTLMKINNILIHNSTINANIKTPMITELNFTIIQHLII